MKILCENMLHPTKSNWRDLLQIADTLDLQRIKLDVLLFLRDNFDILISFDHDIFTRLNEEFPGLFNTILAMRRKTFPPPPSAKFIKHVEVLKINDKKAKEEAASFPWFALIILFVSAYLYSHAIQIVSIGPLIPIINSLFMIGLLYYAYTMISKQWKIYA